MNIPASRLRLIPPELLRGLLPTMIINLLCALVVTYLMRIGAGFVENLVFSICIGTTAMVLIDQLASLVDDQIVSQRARAVSGTRFTRA